MLQGKGSHEQSELQGLESKKPKAATKQVAKTELLQIERGRLEVKKKCLHITADYYTRMNSRDIPYESDYTRRNHQNIYFDQSERSGKWKPNEIKFLSRNPSTRKANHHISYFSKKSKYKIFICCLKLMKFVCKEIW